MISVTKTKRGRIVEADGRSAFHGGAYYQGMTTYRIYVPDTVAQDDDTAADVAQNVSSMRGERQAENRALYGYTGCRILSMDVVR